MGAGWWGGVGWERFGWVRWLRAGAKPGGRSILARVTLWRRLTPPIAEPFLLRGDHSLDLVSVSGPEAGSYLHGQLSANVTNLSVGQCVHTLLLQPQGKMVAWARLIRTAEESFVLAVDTGGGAAMVERLNRFKLRTKCEIATDTVSIIAVRASETIPDLGSPVADDATLRFIPLLWANLAGVDVIADAAGGDLGDSLASIEERDDLIEALRIAAGIPAHGREITERTIPAELGVVDLSTDFSKGCYVGQELVARMDSRGNNAPRQIRVVSGLGPVPEAGEVVVDDSGEAQVEIGSLSSVAGVSDGWVALASIKRAGLEAASVSVRNQPVQVG